MIHRDYLRIDLLPLSFSKFYQILEDNAIVHRGHYPQRIRAILKLTEFLGKNRGFFYKNPALAIEINPSPLAFEDERYFDLLKSVYVKLPLINLLVREHAKIVITNVESITGAQDLRLCIDHHLEHKGAEYFQYALPGKFLNVFEDYLKELEKRGKIFLDIKV